MGIVSKTVTVGAMAGGLALASQMPEFAQQYRQRLGGALEELRIVVADFDRDAGNSNMTRADALATLKRSSEQFPRDRGFSMERTITRFENLSLQSARFNAANPVARPVHLFSNPDGKLFGETWRDFEPAVPLTAAGGLWGALGALAALILVRIPIGISRRVRRSRGGEIKAEEAPARKTILMHGVRVDAGNGLPEVALGDAGGSLPTGPLAGQAPVDPQKPGATSLLNAVETAMDLPDRVEVTQNGRGKA